MQKPDRPRYGLHLLLFVLTFVSTTFSGGMWAGRFTLYESDAWFSFLGMPIGMSYVMDGLRFSVPFLLFLTVHEFGHYFAAKAHGVRASLPYYIPMPIGIGTLGAVIALKEPLLSPRQLFDVGAAGPLAGFVVALTILLYALFTLPPPTYLMDMPGHEFIQAYIAQYGAFPTTVEGDPLQIGGTVLYWALTFFFDNVPPPYEMYHYPTLFAGWLALFFTALNLLPVGQLDGGHVVFALLGAKIHRIVARVTVSALVFLGILELYLPLVEVHAGFLPAWLSPFAATAMLSGLAWLMLRKAMPGAVGVGISIGVVTLAGTAALLGASAFGYSAWIFWALILSRLIGVDHPPVFFKTPLTQGRKVLGWICIALLVLCFTPQPFHGQF